MTGRLCLLTKHLTIQQKRYNHTSKTRSSFLTWPRTEWRLKKIIIYSELQPHFEWTDPFIHYSGNLTPASYVDKWKILSYYHCFYLFIIFTYSVLYFYDAKDWINPVLACQKANHFRPAWGYQQLYRHHFWWTRKNRLHTKKIKRQKLRQILRPEGSQKHGLTIIHTRLRTETVMLILSDRDLIVCSIPHSFMFTPLAKRQTRSHNQCWLSAFIIKERSARVASDALSSAMC